MYICIIRYHEHFSIDGKMILLMILTTITRGFFLMVCIMCHCAAGVPIVTTCPVPATGEEEVIIKPVVAITFDDGPDRRNTPAILDILNDYGVKATFFLIGENMSYHPAIVKRIHQEGHLAANHSWTHTDFNELSISCVIEKELLPTDSLLELHTGLASRILRPPYGAMPDTTLHRLKKEGWIVVRWSLDTFDWNNEYNKPCTIVERVRERIRPGAIILMHSGGGNRKNTIEALPLLIEMLQEKGYDFVTVDALLLD